MGNWLLRLARRTYRDRGESPVASGADLAAKYALGAGVLGLLAWSYAPLAVRHVREWESFRIDVPVPAMAWRMDLEGSADCPDFVDSRSDCPANPARPRLWTSPVERGDPYVALRSPHGSTRKYVGSHFWLGTEVPVGQLEVAASRRANQFVLGWLNAPYRIWVDGQIAQEGDGTLDTDPIFLMIPMSRLSEARPLRIAVRLMVAPNMPVLDAFNEDRTGRDLGADGHGFMTQGHAVVYRALVGFWGKSRPFALAVGYLAIAALMFFFWFPLKNKPEYFYMSLFAVSGAIFQCERFDLFNFGRSAALNSDLELLSLFWMPSLGLVTGLAFARVKNRIINRCLAVTLGLPLGVLAFVPPGALHELFKLLTIVFYVPFAPVLAGLVCLVHAYHLAEQSKSHLSAPVRIRRLTWFGLMEIANGILFLAVFHDIGSAPKRIYWVGLEQMFFYISFCAIVLSEYSLQEYLVRNTPVSEYHQRPILPEMLSGAVLTVDLKNSERLFRAGASIGEGAQFVDKCLSAMWTATVKSGGVVLQTEGDSLRAFFDQAKVADPVAAALRAVDEMAKRLAEVDLSLRQDGLVEPAEPGIAFRGGLSYGKVKPIWLENGKTRQASWTEVGDTNALVESSRFMELERGVREPGEPAGLVVLADSLVPANSGAAPPFEGRIVQRRALLIGKHGRSYECAVYSAAPGPAARARRVA